MDGPNHCGTLRVDPATHGEDQPLRRKEGHLGIVGDGAGTAVSGRELPNPLRPEPTANIVEGVELDHAVKSLVEYDQNVIESASSAFSAYSQRDGFQESKRTFAYFMGIVKNKQKAVDQDRR